MNIQYIYIYIYIYIVCSYNEHEHLYVFLPFVMFKRVIKDPIAFTTAGKSYIAILRLQV